LAKTGAEIQEAAGGPVGTQQPRGRERHPAPRVTSSARARGVRASLARSARASGRGTSDTLLVDEREMADARERQVL